MRKEVLEFFPVLFNLINNERSLTPGLWHHAQIAGYNLVFSGTCVEPVNESYKCCFILAIYLTFVYVTLFRKNLQ